MKTNFLILAFLLLFSSVKSQEPDTIARPRPETIRKGPALKDRFFFGGDIGLSFGTVTYIHVAPIIGFKLTEKLATGIGPSYSYLKDKRYKGYEYTTNTYGGRVFGQYRVIENAMAYAEYELLNAEVFDDFKYRFTREYIPSLLVGGGYISPIGDNSSFNLMLLFNVIENRYSYYENPIIRAGFNVGF